MQKQRQNRSQKHIQQTALVFALAAICAFTSGCVSPGEFDEVNRDCNLAQGEFDSEARDAFCSGRWEGSDVSIQESTLNFDSNTFIRIEGSSLTALRVDPEENILEVRVFKKNPIGTYYEVPARPSEDGVTDPVIEPFVIDMATAGLRDFDYESILSVSLLGFSDETEYTNRLSLAMISRGQDGGVNEPQISFFRLWGDASMMRRDESAKRLMTEEKVNGDNVVIPDSGMSPDVARRCNMNSSASRVRFRKVSSFVMDDPHSDAKRQFSFVAAECAIFVYGYAEYMDEPVLLTQIPMDALDVEIGTIPNNTIDTPSNSEALEDIVEQRFLYVASGFEGLRINRLEDLKTKLHQDFDDVDPRIPESGTASGSDQEVQERSSAFSAIDADSFARNANPVSDAAINVTQLAASNNRVFYINEYTQPGHPIDGRTYLVSAQVDASGVLQEQRSVPVSDDDHLYEDLTWRLVNLGNESESMFAVLRNTQSSQTGARQSKIKIYDAPEGSRPHSVMDLPIGRPVSNIFEENGELWVMLSDALQVYSFSISGDPL